jgi:hypothetical protein
MELVSHFELRVAMAVGRGQFGSTGRGTSAFGTRYQTTSEETAT